MAGNGKQGLTAGALLVLLLVPLLVLWLARPSSRAAQPTS